MQRAGTAPYMAPEMILGEYDEKVDVFSVGAILYQLMTGKHPFYEPGIDDEAVHMWWLLFNHQGHTALLAPRLPQFVPLFNVLLIVFFRCQKAVAGFQCRILEISCTESVSEGLSI